MDTNTTLETDRQKALKAKRALKIEKRDDDDDDHRGLGAVAFVRAMFPMFRGGAGGLAVA